jgi:hypothetical protein
MAVPADLRAERDMVCGSERLATPFVENPNTRLVKGKFRVQTGLGDAEYKSRLSDYKQ